MALLTNDDDKRLRVNSWFDGISTRTGLPRDPATEARARELGLHLRERALLFGEEEWSRVLDEVEGMGRIECIIVWSISTGGLLSLDDGLDRAKVLHKRLARLVLASLTVPNQIWSRRPSSYAHTTG